MAQGGALTCGWWQVVGEIARPVEAMSDPIRSLAAIPRTNASNRSAALTPS